ncbi:MULTISPECIES: photosystem II complex extrinsic protein PsbU [Trichocoleus]|uniref:Photosystem II extrinsic protein U n=1 Tax=Trichocoleus desertorum GB2-A4 TaxID=2933944 RepID=A0ABV0J3L6_9CYAN|nr:photosystem II complex extrinsic protein PsbU [Trichocoleus sp. FACHB-46]MBD1861721.1 photosystem II complex extrinsic protein PsbU [Trichocoleus sp. FACHB-46]
MKRFVRWLSVLSLLVGCLGWLGLPQQAIAANLSHLVLQPIPVLAAEVAPRNAVDDKRAKVGDKIDLNNTNVRAFLQYPGLYPTLARAIVQHAPYEKVEDVLDLPGISDLQKETLQANFKNFTVTDPDSALTEGDDRFNNGIYR